MSASLTLFFRAEYVLCLSDCRRRLGKTLGTRSVFIMGILDMPPVKAIVLWATGSIGRSFLRAGAGRGSCRSGGGRPTKGP